MVKKIKKKSFMKFEDELTEGIIKERKGQFILIVDVDGKEHRCHCPTTGAIGGIILKNIPCLMSKSNNPKRTTEFTVEAISLDKPDKKNKKWIGINQVKANKYIEHFLKEGKFSKMFKKVNTIKREQKLGDSKLDFLINDNCYMEVKSPLHNLNINIPSYLETRKKNMLYAGNRLIAFQYNSEKFGKKEKKENVKNFEKIQETVDKIYSSGVESWQVNLSIDKKGISFLDHFKLQF